MLPPAPTDERLKVRNEVPDIETNRSNVLAFNDLMFNQKNPREALNLYAGATFTEHNPLVCDGKDGFIEFFERMAHEFPDQRIDVRRSVAEGDLVVLHSKLTRPGRPDTVAIDIFRVDEAGKVVEHWDAVQPIPGESLNGNGMI